LGNPHPHRKTLKSVRFSLFLSLLCIHLSHSNIFLRVIVFLLLISSSSVLLFFCLPSLEIRGDATLGQSLTTLEETAPEDVAIGTSLFLSHSRNLSSYECMNSSLLTHSFFFAFFLFYLSPSSPPLPLLLYHFFSAWRW
jgi:hypothetical protein